MLAKTRQEIIQKLLRQEGAVTTARLVEQFGVSLETVRRDLLTMEKAGLLSRVHGGAVGIGEMMPYRPLENRNQEQNSQKDALCRNAVKLVAEGDYIAVGTGSTPVHFARLLKEAFRKLTVVTYSRKVFEVLQEHPGFELILLGGKYLPEEDSFFGQLTMDMLSQLHVQKSFVFPSAVSLEHGICGYEQTLYPLQRMLLTHCDQGYILADSSKFEKKALYKVDDLRREYIYVTDPQLPEELERIYEENGLQIVTGRKI